MARIFHRPLIDPADQDAAEQGLMEATCRLAYAPGWQVPPSRKPTEFGMTCWAKGRFAAVMSMEIRRKQWWLHLSVSWSGKPPSRLDILQWSKDFFQEQPVFQAIQDDLSRVDLWQNWSEFQLGK